MPQHPDGSHGLRKPKSPKKKIAPSKPISPPKTLTDLQRRLKKRRDELNQATKR